MSDLVLVDLNGHLSALNAPDFATLDGAVKEAYGHLVKNAKTHEVGVCYEWRGLTLDVKSTQTLDTFKSLCAAGQIETADGIPVLRVVLAEKVTEIPTLEEVAETMSRGGSRAPSRGGSRPSSRSASRNRHHHEDEAEEDDYDDEPVQRKKAARPMSAGALRSAAGAARQPPPQSLRQTPPSTARPRKAAAPVEDVDVVPVVDSPPRRQDLPDHGAPSPGGIEVARSSSPEHVWIGDEHRNRNPARPNSAVARELLDSFREPSPPPGPMIRALMRDGSHSALVPFDVDKPPSVAAMRRDVWTHFGEALEDKLAELRGTPEGKAAEAKLGRPLVAGQFLLSFWFEGCDLPVDVEDESDMDLMARAVGRFGLENVNVYVDVPFVDLKPVKPNTVTGTVPATSPRGLQINQTRTKLRSGSSVRL